MNAFGSLAAGMPAAPAAAGAPAAAAPMAGGMNHADLLRMLQMLQGQGQPAAGGDMPGLLPMLLGKAKPGGLVGDMMNAFQKPQQAPGLPMNLNPAFGVPSAPAGAASPFTGGLGGLY